MEKEKKQKEDFWFIIVLVVVVAIIIFFIYSGLNKFKKVQNLDERLEHKISEQYKLSQKIQSFNFICKSVYFGIKFLFFVFIGILCYVVYKYQPIPFSIKDYVGDVIKTIGGLAILLTSYYFITDKKKEDIFSVRDNIKIAIWNCFYPDANIDRKNLIENSITIEELLAEKMKIENENKNG